MSLVVVIPVIRTQRALLTRNNDSRLTKRAHLANGTYNKPEKDLFFSRERGDGLPDHFADQYSLGTRALKPDEEPRIRYQRQRNRDRRPAVRPETVDDGPLARCREISHRGMRKLPVFVLVQMPATGGTNRKQ